MARRLLAAGIASIALAVAAPAMAQGQPAPEVQVEVAAIPGVVAPDSLPMFQRNGAIQPPANGGRK